MIQIVCFSKNRPLQLHGYLESLFRAFEAPEALRVKALVKSDPAYAPAYREVARAFGQVEVVYERDFTRDLLGLLEDRPYTCFGCDDVVFVRPVRVGAILGAFAADVFAFSLRLGRNVTRSMFSGPTAPPPHLTAEGELLTWDLDRSHAHGDWGYAFELNGTVYPTDVVRKVIEDVRAPTPNLLEAGGGGRWSSRTPRRKMRAWASSCLVVPTVNVVQRDFANPICGDRPLSPELLLACYESGMRLDVERFAARAYDCIHVADFFLRRGDPAGGAAP